VIPLGLRKGINEELSAALWNTHQRMSCGAMLSGTTALDPPSGSAIRSKPSGHRIALGRNEQEFRGTDTLEFGGDSRVEVNLLFRLFLQWADT